MGLSYDVLACVGSLCDKAAVPCVVVKETPSTFQQPLGGSEENCTKSWQDHLSPHRSEPGSYQTQSKNANYTSTFSDNDLNTL